MYKSPKINIVNFNAKDVGVNLASSRDIIVHEHETEIDYR